MDLAMGLTKWLAGPIARFVDADGETAGERRAEVIEHAGLPGEYLDDLGLRHATRAVAWFILCGVAVAVAAVVVIPISVFANERMKDLAFDIAEWVIFFPFWMAAVHAVKMVVIRYLPERRWNPRSRLWRAALLAQTPDYLLAALLTAANALWW
ncbi:hypothetical protein O7614_24675 [Micromonospora sp. WMMD961]|uniref:hypothetical protein n=1 Tax=Micromonospora sp. WMMD961 TaxID=3016100 RepID=UPI00241754F1|nr:hypothetical protein [Micromonospora sp. WMMD961]MDG4782862.1 hypothetical protein [Micromonospora sp. WMMD961]